jgi:hypothetical protein
MGFQFEEEKQIEYWLKPFTCSALLPGYRRTLITDTQWFWDTYWQLLETNYTEQELADYAVWWAFAMRPMSSEAAFVHAVLYIGWRYELKPSPAFHPYRENEHPRHRLTRTDNA